MGIICGPAMSGEVFIHADNPLLVQAPELRCSHLSDKLRVRTEGTIFHHLIIRICEHIRIRRRIHVKSKIAQVGSDRASDLIRFLSISSASHITHVSDLLHTECRIASNARHLSAFFIHRQKYRESRPLFCILLRIGKHRPCLIRILQILRKINQTAHRILVYRILCTCPCLDNCPYTCQCLRRDHKELAHLFFKCHRLQNFPGFNLHTAVFPSGCLIRLLFLSFARIISLICLFTALNRLSGSIL